MIFLKTVPYLGPREKVAL